MLLRTDSVIAGFTSLADPFDDAAYLTSNNIDPDFDFSSDPADSTNEYVGLTIVEFDSVLDAVRFLNGYAVQ